MTRNVIYFLSWTLIFSAASAKAADSVQVEKKVEKYLESKPIQYQTYKIIDSLTAALTSPDQKTREAGISLLAILMYDSPLAPQVASDLNSGTTAADEAKAILATHPDAFSHLGKIVIDNFACAARNGVTLEPSGPHEQPVLPSSIESIPVKVKWNGIDRDGGLDSFWIGTPDDNTAYFLGGKYNANLTLVMSHAAYGDVEEYNVGLYLDPYNHGVQDVTGDLTTMEKVKISDMKCKIQLSSKMPEIP